MNNAPDSSFNSLSMELCWGAKALSWDSRTEGAIDAVIERCRKNDEAAFGQFVDLFQSRVYGFVLRMVKNPDEAADITQEVFIRAYQNFHRFDNRSSVRTWLFRIAHNLCIDRARKLARTPGMVGLVDADDGEEIAVPDERWQPEQMILDAELLGIFEAALAAMSDKLKTVLLLHDREDMQYEEIAATLGIPVGTVKSRLFLARAFMQKALTPYLGERS